MSGEPGRETGREAGFRRILVALSASEEGRALLDFAAGLATELGVSLTGVFIEDTDATEFAELPFAREVCLSGASVRDLSRKRMQAHFRSEAAAAERLLQDIGKARRVEYNFEVRRGRFETELAALATETDLLALSPASGLVVRSRRRDVFARFGKSAALGFLSYSKGFPIPRNGQRIVVVYTGSPQSASGVALAARLSARSGVPLTLIAGVGVDLDEARQALRALSGTALIEDLVKAEASVADVIRTGNVSPRLVILPSDLLPSEQAAIRDLGVPVIALRRDMNR